MPRPIIPRRRDGEETVWKRRVSRFNPIFRTFSHPATAAGEDVSYISSDAYYQGLRRRDEHATLVVWRVAIRRRLQLHELSATPAANSAANDLGGRLRQIRLRIRLHRHRAATRHSAVQGELAILQAARTGTVPNSDRPFDL